jgi:hypothetical protein
MSSASQGRRLLDGKIKEEKQVQLASLGMTA